MLYVCHFKRPICTVTFLLFTQRVLELFISLFNPGIHKLVSLQLVNFNFEVISGFYIQSNCEIAIYVDHLFSVLTNKPPKWLELLADHVWR